MQINPQGNYKYCRWAMQNRQSLKQGLHNTDLIEWFQSGLSGIRNELLNGQIPAGCSDCHVMEKHGKISGRQRQLLKVGVKSEYFIPSMASSPWKGVFNNSLGNNGCTDQIPQDWQIDLGNYCNSACLFCDPHSSSRLAAEHKKLGIIQQLPPNNWVDNPELIEKFLSTLRSSKQLCYLHFIGGETLITPAFAKILSALIDCGLNHEVSIGFTTNLTVWNESVVDLLSQFREVNLGMSIECFHPVNDYVRYGGNLNDTEMYLEKWLGVADQLGWLTQLRITPTILTVLHLDTVYRYALSNKLAVESCNFIDKPEFMRPTVLPLEYRVRVINRLQTVVNSVKVESHAPLVNSRDRFKFDIQLTQDINSYIDYLSNAEDESFRLPDLIRYLKNMESNRKNCVLDYVPEYEELFRSAGY
jgi:hypothetical protein